VAAGFAGASAARQDGQVATYFDEHADLAPIQRRRVAVLGDDDEAVVHATLLRDSGVDVHIGTTPGSEASRAGEIEGLLCVEAAEAAAEADVLVVTRGDAAVGLLLDAARPHLVAGDVVVVTDAVPLRFGLLALPAEADVVLVQPLAAASVVAAEFSVGRGVPAVISVEQDVSGHALEFALSYARAIGGTRAGAIGATVAAAGETALFGQHAVVGGALDGLVRAAFETLVDADYPRDLAYMACVHSLQAAVERAYGFEGVGVEETQRDLQVRRAGGRRFADAHLRAELESALVDVQAGRVLETRRAAGQPGPLTAPTAPERDPLEAAGRRVRRLMPWISTTEEDARHAR
jgi:ketol-acid reductoisomerase